MVITFRKVTLLIYWKSYRTHNCKHNSIEETGKPTFTRNHSLIIIRPLTATNLIAGLLVIARCPYNNSGATNTTYNNLTQD